MILSDINVMTTSIMLKIWLWQGDFDRANAREAALQGLIFLVVVVFFVIAADLFLRVTDVSSSFVHVVGEFK